MNVLKLILTVILLNFSTLVDAQSNKPVIGIGELKSTVGGDVNSFRAMLETAIAGTNKFDLIERSRIGDLIKEQALSSGGITQGNGQIGGISGVEYLIYGSITKLGVQNTAVNLGNFKTAGKTGVMSVDLRVVDSSTGSIKISETVEVKSSISSGTSIAGKVIGGSEASPLSTVQRIAADTIAAKIALSIFPIKVVNVKANKVYLNYGPPILSKCSWVNSNSCYLKIVSMGEGFTDPDTGEVLGADEEYVGTVEVVDPKKKYSIANILEGNIERGLTAMIISGSEGKKLKKRIQKANKRH